nr:MAG TPA: HD domain-containing protein [Caudoviricetes sp.]
MLKIKDIKHGQIFYGISDNGEPYGFKAWGDAKLVNGGWIVEGDPNSKTIKLADLISNSRSIVKHDKDFARVYIKEKELLLDVLTEGDTTLYAMAKQIVEDAKKELGLE